MWTVTLFGWVDSAKGLRVSVSELVQVELDRHDWTSLRCGCGDSAEHVPLMFEAILTAETPGQMIGYTLDDHLEISTNLFECAVPAVSVILAALAGDLSMLARNHPGTADQAIAAADSLAGPVDPQNASRWGFGIWSAVSWLPRPTWISHFAESLQLALR